MHIYLRPNLTVKCSKLFWNINRTQALIKLLNFVVLIFPYTLWNNHLVHHMLQYFWIFLRPTIALHPRQNFLGKRFALIFDILQKLFALFKFVVSFVLFSTDVKSPDWLVNLSVWDPAFFTIFLSICNKFINFLNEF